MSGTGKRIVAGWPVVLCCFVLAMAVWAAHRTAAAEKAEPVAHYEDARNLFDKRDYKGAIINLKAALQKNPDNLPARILLGQAYLVVGDSRSAVKELTRARRAGADDAFILVPLAKAYSQLGEHKRILIEIRRGNRDPGIEADVRLIRGRAHLALDHLDEAQRAFAEVARIRPDNADSYIEHARLQLKRKDAEAAEELVGAALYRAPENAEAWFVSGDLKRFKGDLEGAVEDFGKAVGFEPLHTGARMARAGTLIDLGRHEEAEPDVLNVRERSPYNPRALYFHALILTNADKPKEAEIALGAAAKILEGISPEMLEESPPALLLAGTVAYFRKDFESAYNHLARYVELQPRHATARRTLGSLLLRRGEPARAIEILRPAVDLAPKDARIAAMLGTALMQVRRHAEAAEMFRRASALAPNSAALQTHLGLTRLNAGQKESAAKALRRALALDADDTQAAVLLGLTNLRQGDFKAALKAAQILVEQDPKNSFAHNMAGGAHLGLGELPAARASFLKAIEADQGYEPARFNLAGLELRLGNVDASVARYREILEGDAKSARALSALARIAERQGNRKEAIRWLEKTRFADPKRVAEQIRLVELYIVEDDQNAALKVARSLARSVPRNPAALVILGRAEQASGAHESALKTFRRLSTLAETGRSAVWLVRAARLQTRIEDVDGASASLQAAIGIDAKYLPAQAAMFEHEISLGKLEAAQHRAEQLRASHPDSALGITLLGDLALRRDRYGEAAKAYAAGFKRFRKSALLIRLYRARRAAGQPGDAVKLLEDWVAERPEDDTVRRMLATAYMDGGRDAESMALHEALLKASPDDPALLNNLALLYYRKGDPRALSFAENAYRRAPNQPGTIDTYGWILVRNGETKKGLELLRNARVRAPKVPEIHYHIAFALHRLGRDEEALRELEPILMESGDFEGAAEARVLWQRLSGG